MLLTQWIFLTRAGGGAGRGVYLFNIVRIVRKFG